MSGGRAAGAPFLFTTAELESRGAARALLVTVAYPPCAEVGAARWEGFSPFMIDAGWELDVIMEDPSTLPIVDWSRIDALPAGIRVIGVPRPLPGWVRTLTRIKRAIEMLRSGPAVAQRPSVWTAVEAPSAPANGGGLRAHLLAEGQIQQSARWVRDVERAARHMLDGSHRVVVSSGPPNIAHVAAARVARAAGLPHVMDMRDPWTTSLVPDTPLSRLERRDGEGEERATLFGAARIITNTAEAGARLTSRFPALADRVVEIPNGSDLTPTPAADAPALSRFVIAHCGSLYLDRDPRALLRAIARLKDEEGLTREDLGVVFMGPTATIEGRGLEAWGKEFGLADVLDVRPIGSRDAARELLLQSAVAVAFQGQSVIQIPAKVFEYAAFPVWLFALVGHESATASLLAGSDAVVLAMEDEAGIHAALRRALAQFRSAGRPDPVGIDGRFSRERQARRLLAVLDAAAGPRG